MILNKKQTQAIDILEDKTINELLFGGGAGGSKSVLGCYWIAKMCLKYPLTRWVIGRASLKTLKETTLNTMFWVLSSQGLKPKEHFVLNNSSNILTFSNGSEILFKDLAHYPSDPNYDELGSLEITGAFVDECNQITIKCWNILKSRIRYKLDENNLVPKILGTCNPTKNWVYSEFYYPQKNGTISEKRRFIQALLSDNPNISKHYKENLLTLDKESKERLLFGNWEYDSDPSTLCSYDAICDCFTNSHVTADVNKKSISADLAMQGHDNFIAAYWEGLVCNIEIVQNKSTGKSIEKDLTRLKTQKGVSNSRIVADSDGLGSYLESYMNGIKTFHGGSSAIDSINYFNLKSECGFKLAEFINKREIKINCTEIQKELIIQELGVLKRMNIDNDISKKRIIPKDEMKILLNRSPDFLDILIMQMYFYVTPQRTFTGHRIMK